MGAGLLLYDLWAGRHLPRARHMSRRAALEAAPALRPDSLVGAVRFTTPRRTTRSTRCTWRARLPLHGASIATRVRVASFIRDETGRILGVRADDRLTGRHSKSGPGTRSPPSASRRIGCSSMPPAGRRATAALERRAPGRPSLLDPGCGPGLFMRTEKSIFHAIPWGQDHWLLGDTDTEWDGEVDTPVANRTDVEYVLAKVNSVLRAGRWSGARSAVCSRDCARSSPPKAPRHHPALPRAPAALARARPDGDRRWQVHDLPCHGTGRRRRGGPRPRVDGSLDDRPASAAGGRATAGRRRTGSGFVTAAARTRCWRSPRPTRTLAAPLAGAGRYMTAEAIHAVTHQGALDLDDILSRRTRVSIETVRPGPCRRGGDRAAGRARAGVVGGARCRGARALHQAARRRGGRGGRAGRRRGRSCLPGASSTARPQARAPGP